MKLPAIFRLKTLEISAFLLLLGGAFAVRTYRLTSALGDWHSFRQADTASVTREYVKRGIDLYRPQYHDQSNIQSGLDNLVGWRMVEFPLVNGVIAATLRWQTDWDLVITSRLFSVGAALISISVFFWLVRSLYGSVTAFVSSAVFAFMPYSIYFSRTILPEPFAVMFALLAAAAVRLWNLRRNDIWLLLAGMAFALALLVKPMALFYAPFLVGIWWRQRGKGWQPLVKAVAVGALSLVPLGLWRNWILQFPSGIPASDWLLNGNNIRFRPAWWRWLFADRFGRLMFGYWGAPFLLLGIPAGCSTKFAWPKTRSLIRFTQGMWDLLDSYLAREGSVLLGTLGMLAYISIFATGNVQHDYYQYFLVPVVALLWTRGALWLASVGRGIQRWCLIGVVGAAALFSLFFSWYEIRGNFDVKNPAIVPAGRAVDRRTPADAKVIAPGFGDTTLLFQTNRRGWPIGFEIPDKIAKGAQFYITTSQDDEANELMRRYPVMEKTDEYILIDLRQPLPGTAEPVQ